MVYGILGLRQFYENHHVTRRDLVKVLGGVATGAILSRATDMLPKSNTQTTFVPAVPNNPAIQFFDLYDRHRELINPKDVSTKVGDTLYYTDSDFTRTLFGKVLYDSPLELTRVTHPKKDGTGKIYEYDRREKFYIDLSTGQPLYFELVPKHSKSGNKIPIENFEPKEKKEIERKSVETLEALTTKLREQIRTKVANSE